MLPPSGSQPVSCRHQLSPALLVQQRKSFQRHRNSFFAYLHTIWSISRDDSIFCSHRFSWSVLLKVRPANGTEEPRSNAKRCQLTRTQVSKAIWSHPYFMELRFKTIQGGRTHIYPQDIRLAVVVSAPLTRIKLQASRRYRYVCARAKSEH